MERNGQPSQSAIVLNNIVPLKPLLNIRIEIELTRIRKVLVDCAITYK